MCDKIGCPYCGKEYHNQSMSKHIKRKHSNELEEKFNCNYCDKLHDASFSTGYFCSLKCSLSNRENHSVKITNIKSSDITKENTFKNGKFHCPDCKSSFIQFSRLTSHIFKKHVKKTGLCEKCGEKHDGSYGIGRFCSIECAKSREFSKESIDKMSKSSKLAQTYNINLFRNLKLKNPNYDYSSSVYYNLDSVLKIKCKKHGFFNIKYDLHKNGTGCEECSEDKRLEKYIADSNITHNNKYGYSKTKLGKRTDERIIVKCPKHDFFDVFAHHHKRGVGCSKCAIEESIIPFNELLEDFYKIHKKEDYIFHEDTYINGNEKMKTTCKKCNTVSWKTPKSIKEGSCCDICYPPHYGFDKSKKGFLYYIRIDINNEIYYKVGITNLSVKKRFSEYERQFMTIIRLEEFELGLDAYNKEQSILKKNKRFQYKGEKILESGNTELFIYDVLNLDK